MSEQEQVHKKKRTLNPHLAERAAFIKANYDKVRHLPNKERLKVLSEMFKASREPKGGGDAGIASVPSGGSEAIPAIPSGAGLEEVAESRPKRVRNPKLMAAKTAVKLAA